MKMKDVMQTANVLIKYNDWRTKESINMVKPSKVTKHLDNAIYMLCDYAVLLAEKEANPTLTFENSVVVPKEEKFKLGDIIQSVDGRRIVITENNDAKLRGYEIGGESLLMEFYPKYIKYKE